MNKREKAETLNALGELFSEIFDQKITFVDITDDIVFDDDSCNCKESCAPYDDDCCDYDLDPTDVEVQPIKVIINNPATIVYWEDGTKTIVKCQKGDVFDIEKGIAMATLKKLSGNDGSYNKYINFWTKNAIIERA